VLIVDTGPLVATADRADKDHTACRTLLEGDDGPLLTTALVIAEAAYLIDRQLGPKAEARLYDSILGGQLEVASLDREDWERIAELVSTYADLRLGGTDASWSGSPSVSALLGSPPSTTATSESSARAMPERSSCCPDRQVAGSRPRRDARHASSYRAIRLAGPSSML
jgi:uncharacterized protein